MADPIQFNVLSPDFIDDPYPIYHRLRAEDPVHLSPMGVWILSRYDDVALLLRDPRFGRRGFDELLSARFGRGGLGKSMLFRDPPDHTRLRALVSKGFTPKVIEGMRDKIQHIVDGLLDAVQGAGRMDVIADLAYPLPVTVICEMVGVPAGDRERFERWSHDIARSLDAIAFPDPDVAARAARAQDALTQYFHELIEERRRRPRGDLLSALIAAEEAGDRLSTEELYAAGILLFIAGHETTVNLIGNGTLALLRHPEQMQRLREEPALVPAAVEELLRYDSPVQRTGRLVYEDVVLSGKTVPKGAFAIALLGAANRDPAHFPDPDRLDITRGAIHHLAFGWGIHFCLGAPLARLEGQIALGTLLKRFPRLRLAADRLERWETSTLRGLKALPVEFCTP